MKELKNKEVIIGLIAFIILCMIAIFLILKREFPQEQKNMVSVEEMNMEDGIQGENELFAEENADDVVGVELVKTPEAQEEQKQTAGSDTVQNLGLKEYADTLSEFYTAPQYVEYTGEDMWQLEELFGYWDAYHLEAVDDLIRLPRLRTAFTNELAGTNDFYYYGSFNKAGQPDGRGVAVYADNTYYCGDWKNGKRHGKGMWLRIFPDKPSTVNGVTGVVVHSYNGDWERDLPNGKGQEHFEYDLEEMEGEDIILNVIGSFKDGCYDDELYIMTIDKKGNTTDWEANAQKGVFEYCHNVYGTTGKLPVWNRMEEPEEGESKYRWMLESENVNWGIFGLKKMN